MAKTPDKMYITYDGRAIGGFTGDASVLLATESRKEAIQWAREYSGVVYQYDVKNDELVNEKEIYIFSDSIIS